MAEQNTQKIKTRIQHKHDLEVNWNNAAGFYPLPGELIIYDKDADHDYIRFKIGDGIDNVIDLPFISHPEIYVGNGDMPDEATIQFILDPTEDDSSESVLTAVHNTDTAAHLDIRNSIASIKESTQQLKVVFTDGTETYFTVLVADNDENK